MIDRPTLEDIEMTREEAELFARIDPVLRKFHLSLYCERCHREGRKDGVQGQNWDQASEFTVACGCSVRRYRRGRSADA